MAAPVVRVRRIAAATTVLAVLAVLPAAAVPRADDDPGPVEWPSVQAPDTGGGSDPEPIEWPRPEPA